MIPIPSLSADRPFFDARPPRPVVLLRSPGAPHTHAWGRALQLAAALRTSVVEVQLLDEPPTDDRQTIDHLRNIRARWERRFGGQLARPPLVVLPAGDTDRLAHSLSTLEPQLLVLGARPGWPTDCVVELAAELGAPCVVARAPRPARAVVASSRLFDPGLPVVREAANVAEALHRPLTVHHHVEPAIAQAPQPDHQPDAEALARARGAAVALTRGVDPVTGILAVADASDADLVVVGTARGHREARREVATRVAAQCTHTVMVVPTPA